MEDVVIQPGAETNGSFMSWLRINVIKAVAIVFWLVIVLAVVAYQRATGLPPRELAAQLADQLAQFIAGTWYGPFIYTFIYFLRPVILFPASVLTILAGNLYGLWVGLFWGLFAGTMSSVIPFFAGYWLFGRGDENVSEREDLNRLQKFAGLLRDNPIYTVITMRLLFLPYDAVSVFVGGLRIPFWKFFLATFLGNIVGAIPYVALGASVEGNPFAEGARLNPWILALAFTMLVLSIGFSRLVKRQRRALLSEESV